MSADIFYVSLVGFLVMVVFPLLFWWALSMAIIKQSRRSVAATVCVGVVGALLTVFAVLNTIDHGYPG